MPPGMQYRISSMEFVTPQTSSRRSDKLGRFPDHTRTVLSCVKTVLFNRVNITLLGVPSDVGKTDLRILKSPIADKQPDPANRVDWRESRLPYFQTLHYVV